MDTTKGQTKGEKKYYYGQIALTLFVDCITYSFVLCVRVCEWVYVRKCAANGRKSTYYIAFIAYVYDMLAARFINFGHCYIWLFRLQIYRTIRIKCRKAFFLSIRSHPINCDWDDLIVWRATWKSATQTKQRSAIVQHNRGLSGWSYKWQTSIITNKAHNTEIAM